MKKSGNFVSHFLWQPGTGNLFKGSIHFMLIHKKLDYGRISMAKPDWRCVKFEFNIDVDKFRQKLNLSADWQL